MDLTPRQKDIITAALKIIAGEGIQKLSVRRISDEVGFTVPALYRHYKSKDDLLLALTNYIVSDWEEVVRRRWTVGSATLNSLGEAMTKMVVLFTGNDMIAAASYSLQILQKDKPILNKIFSIVELATVRTEEILINGQKGGTVRNDIPARDLAAIIFGTLRLLIEKWNLSGNTIDIKTEWESAWRALKKMIEPV